MSAAPAEDRAPAPTTRLLGLGDVVDGRYRIEAYLGGGGMASVYRATHVVLEQPVAIKVVSPQIRELPGMVQRFLREARAATQLKSEHVARVSDVGTMLDGAPYMVMEYLDGRELAALVDSDEVLCVEDAVDYVLQACEALAEVHGLGIVHRDLKPANLFLTRGADGRSCVKLIDFGISRMDSPLASKHLMALTQPDTVMGSPRYMSPEQMESSQKADSRSDIYGVGAVLYELLTRRGPHEGDTLLDIYAAATLGPPATPSSLRGDVPRHLDEAILRCLAIDPADRYTDVAELACALAPFGPEGSLVRAESITRVLEATRGRTRDGAASSPGDDRSPTGRGEHSSHVRRVASSAHSLHKRRMRRASVGVALIALAGLVAGGRVFYMQQRVASDASAAAVAAMAVRAPAPLPSMPAVPSAPSDPPVAVAMATAMATATATTWTPPPPQAATAWSAKAPPAPRSDDELFEDRK